MNINSPTARRFRELKKKGYRTKELSEIKI